MDSAKALEVLFRVGALITDSHIVYTSGRHGSAYLDKDMLYPHVIETSRFCQAIAERFLDVDTDAVVAPEKGGIILSQWVAYWLSVMKHREILAFYAEKMTGGGFTVKRGGAAKVLPGKRVLLVEDLLTTGGSVLKVVEFLRDSIDCRIVGVGALCNRGGVTTAEIGNPPLLECIVNIAMESWPAEECPLCARDAKINTTVGHGKEFLEKHGRAA